MLISDKKCWCQQNSRSVSRDSFIFWVVLRKGITVPSFMIAGYVWQILGRGVFSPHPPPLYLWAAPKRPILNSINSYNWKYFKSLCETTVFLSISFVLKISFIYVQSIIVYWLWICCLKCNDTRQYGFSKRVLYKSIYCTSSHKNQLILTKI